MKMLVGAERARLAVLSCAAQEPRSAVLRTWFAHALACAVDFAGCWLLSAAALSAEQGAAEWRGRGRELPPGPGTAAAVHSAAQHRND